MNELFIHLLFTHIIVTYIYEVSLPIFTVHGRCVTLPKLNNRPNKQSNPPCLPPQLAFLALTR